MIDNRSGCHTSAINELVEDSSGSKKQEDQIMFRTFAMVVAWLTLASCWLNPCWGANAHRLGKKQRTALIEEVAPAYRSGDPLRILNALSPLMNGLDDGQIAEANALLAEHEVPSIQQLLGDARLTLVHQGKSDRLPKPGPRELVMTLDVLKDRAEQVLHALRQHPVIGA